MSNAPSNQLHDGDFSEGSPWEQTPVPPSPLALSPSKLRALGCPHRFRKLYIERVGESEGPQLQMGTLVHEVAAEYCRELRSSGHESDPLALRSIAAFVWDDRPAAIAESEHDTFTALVDRLRTFAVPPGLILAVEDRLAFDADWLAVEWGGPDVAYGGMLDLVLADGDGVRIVDWTTAALGGTQAAKKALQVRIYALLWFMGHEDCGRITVELRSLRTGAVVSETIEPDAHAATAERLASERERLRLRMADPAAEWPATPGESCAICALACPYEDRVGEKVRLRDEAEARAAHEVLIATEARRKKLTALLKGYVGVHGPVETNGVVAEIRWQARYSWDVGRVFRVLAEGGMTEDEIFGALSVDRRRLAKLLRAEQLDHVGRECSTVHRGERFVALGSAAHEAAEGDGE